MLRPVGGEDPASLSSQDANERGAGIAGQHLYEDCLTDTPGPQLVLCWRQRPLLDVAEDSGDGSADSVRPSGAQETGRRADETKQIQMRLV